MTLVNTLRSLVFSDQFLLREVIDFLDTKSLLVLSLSSKNFRQFASRREIWDIDDTNGVCRWPWEDMELKRSLISYVNHYHLDAQVLCFVQSTSSQELMVLLSEPSSVHAIFLLHHLSTTSSSSALINHFQMVGLTGAIPDAAAVVVASKALLYLKSKILQWKWDVVLRTMTGHDMLFEGFLLIADAKSPNSLKSSKDLLREMHGASSGQRDGMDCHRKVLTFLLSFITTLYF